MRRRLSKVAGMNRADRKRGVGIGLVRLDGFGGSGVGHDISEEEQR